MRVAALDAPMYQAMELAWESFRAGSLGIGAVVTHDTEVIATGRNRLGETDPGDDILAGSSLAHAELNALAKLPWREHHDDHLTVWTTLQPCLQCAGAMRLGRINAVQVLAPDPLFRGVERVRDLNEFIASGWPTIVERDVDEWTVLALLLPTHANLCLPLPIPRWIEALPSVAQLSATLVESGELVEHARSKIAVDEVAGSLWDRLRESVNEVRAVAASEQ